MQIELARFVSEIDIDMDEIAHLHCRNIVRELIEHLATLLDEKVEDSPFKIDRDAALPMLRALANYLPSSLFTAADKKTSSGYVVRLPILLLQAASKHVQLSDAEHEMVVEKIDLLLGRFNEPFFCRGEDLPLTDPVKGEYLTALLNSCCYMFEGHDEQHMHNLQSVYRRLIEAAVVERVVRLIREHRVAAGLAI